VVIRPPDGDVAVYLASLDRLLAGDLAFDAIGPGHGRVIGSPPSALRRIAAHRLARERTVASVLAAAGHGTVDDLLPAVYADVPEERHHIARHSLWAHLRKLAAEGRAEVVWDGRPRDGGGPLGELDSTWVATATTEPAS
jgi:glyoxylase-like metal-dependent hydrolase (beta-lactamase superfamily II)